MTTVDFYSNTPDKLVLARLIAHKAYRRGLDIMVHSTDSGMLAELDRTWWRDPAAGFLPHCATDAAHAPQTPIVLGAEIGQLPHSDVLINLDGITPVFFSRFQRLIEIVSTDDADRNSARQRWRFYQQRGYATTHHDMSK
ncbi:MAG TPA: DNA polymerase III subunit chi [Burkholderiales bacterium]|nr:DNA polymerase III subunit chi [Burkholderiales bacterium]